MNSDRERWAKIRYIIIGDGWTYNRERILINLLIYCLQLISFVKSFYALNIVKNVTNLFLLFEKVVEYVSLSNVVHMVIDITINCGCKENNL